MAFSKSNSEKETVKSEPNVVPLCDVLLVLLIIFMVVTPLVQKGVDVQLPTALNSSNMPDNPEVVLSVKADGSLFLKEQRITMETLPAALEEALISATEKKVYLRADQNLEFGKIVDIIYGIQQAGVELVGIITEKKATEES
ncbi:MAG TPA: biopolymer transporter ExbD [Candidatus Saccharicenans sp.]|jgi:biopolymer transport protein TolR|nr:biopolymer transporter ExbD [Candidatus Saccharicenans sp.]HPU93358.1 biopolymer transporter ExbD [Candidatus Saccharicenans sp.]HQE64810.1 biopolymer transporter ExbD [Candidatus Saccharicenans sp.]HQH61689.1 biopolymer transporter ExbD [Candidatus Saccharicenans sp.]HUM33678.1 biopolymer transporter ExbD [Candidatus Saccharicenans sp.]